MKYEEALNLIKSGNELKEIVGYMVSFERRCDGLLHSDFFPDKHAGEKLIPTEKQAWKLATDFANATDSKKYVNIYVIDNNFSPVEGYYKNIINKY